MSKNRSLKAKTKLSTKSKIKISKLKNTTLKVNNSKVNKSKVNNLKVNKSKSVKLKLAKLKPIKSKFVKLKTNKLKTKPKPKTKLITKTKTNKSKTQANATTAQSSKTNTNIQLQSQSHIQPSSQIQPPPQKTNILSQYQYNSEKIPITITIIKEKGTFVPEYKLDISIISSATELILERIRQELIRRVNLGIVELSNIKKTDIVEEKFQTIIHILVQKYFPDSDETTINFLTSYLTMKTLGLGVLELIMDDENLEEIVINQSKEPVWVYHKKHGWLKTNIYLESEEQIKHYASIIGRKVGRQINVANPLLDAHLKGGDRVNSTLSPISTDGNTITIRKFSKDPWTITKFLKSGTLTPEAAALVWTGIQYEMSIIIAGGTASGKTSTLNAFASFFPPNQRIISIEDTREIILPKYLHWVPLNTTLPNPEGKGEISMQDLLVNSLRMRPDRILVGEVRRKRETETLFEAIHTGHSVYATFHANNAKEVIDRLTNPPLDVPKIMLPAISLIVVQFRNRRTGQRRTFQIAEITEKGDAEILMQYDAKKDKLEVKERNQIEEFLSADDNSTFYGTIKTFTGMSNKEVKQEIDEKVKILEYMMRNNIDNIDSVGRVVAEYYTDKPNLLKYLKNDELLPE